jgi:hypothetical protein
VIEAVEAGASRHEAAEYFEVSVASAVKWLQRWNKERSAAPKPRGGSVSPLEVFASEILAVVAEQPDLTLDETLVELRKRRIKTAVARFGVFSIDTTSPLKALSRCRSCVGIEHDRSLLEPGRDLREQLNPHASQRGFQVCEAGNIPARPIEPHDDAAVVTARQR